MQPILPRLPNHVADLTLVRCRRGLAPLPLFRVGDPVIDRRTGARAHVTQIVRVGHAGQPLKVALFLNGLIAMRSVVEIAPTVPALPRVPA